MALKIKILIVIAVIMVVSMTNCKYVRLRPHMSSACGPTSLYYVCKQMRPTIKQEDVNNALGVALPTTSFDELRDAADRLHFHAAGYIIGSERLKHDTPYGVLHVDDCHFVAIVGYSKDGVLIADPQNETDNRTSMWSYSEIENRWDNKILVITP